MDILDGIIWDDGRKNADGWASRSIYIRKIPNRNYPSIGNSIFLIDTEGKTYDFTFIKSNQHPDRVCIGQPGTLKPWFKKHYPRKTVINDTVYFIPVPDKEHTYKIYSSQQYNEF